MVKVLITGLTGFVGSHLCDYLLTIPGIKVYGFDRYRSQTDNITHLNGRVHIATADLCDYQSIYKLIGAVKPDYIFHLAAMSFVQQSFLCPDECHRVNVGGSVNILEAVAKLKLNTVIQLASTSETYGLVKPSEVPIKETNQLRPQSPYGHSKVEMESLAKLYYYDHGLKVIITRGFNHTGPRRNECFAESTFAKQIAEAEYGLRPPVIKHGNLEAMRDYTDVRDMVRAYWLAARFCNYAEPYNICSGITWRIMDVLKNLAAMSKIKFELETDPERMRPSEVPILLGDCTKFVKQTGWKPEIDFNETLSDLLNYWRVKVEHLQPAAKS